MVKLMVADNHPIVTKGLELVFANSRDIKFVASVADGEAIFDALKQYTTDILICEIDLPKLNGISVLRRIKKENPEVKVIIYSAQQEEVYAVSAIKAGADGYVNKSTDLLTLKNAIMKVYLGGLYISPNLSRKIALDKNSGKSNYYKKLSTREVEVLKLLSNGRRNKEIAEELQINEKTVSTYRARLMKKLNVTNLIDLVNQAKSLDL